MDDDRRVYNISTILMCRTTGYLIDHIHSGRARQ